MRASFLSAAAILGAVSAAPAAAVPGGVINDRPNMTFLGECMYRTHHKTALSLLNADAPKASNRAYARLANETTCSGKLPSNTAHASSSLTFSKGLIRGALAEQFLRTSPAVAQLQPLPLQSKRYVRPWFVATGRDVAADEMAACIADTNPAGIVAVIGTEPLSREEDAAMLNLRGSLGGCLIAGTRLQASREAMRAALADALYQRVRNPALSGELASGVSQ